MSTAINGQLKRVEPDAQEKAVLDAVLEAIRRVRFGSIQAIVQDSRVVQIDTVEKKRF